MNDDEKNYDEWLKEEKTKSNFGKLVLGIIGFFIIAFMMVFVYYGIIYPPEKQLESNNTCMELMDMDFQTEQECVKFVQSLLGEIEVKLDDPKIQELLKNYQP